MPHHSPIDHLHTHLDKAAEHAAHVDQDARKALDEWEASKPADTQSDVNTSLTTKGA